MKDKYDNPQWNYDKEAFELIRDKGKVGSILFCEAIIAEKKKQISEMKHYDGDMITTLDNAIMYFRCVRSAINSSYF